MHHSAATDILVSEPSTKAINFLIAFLVGATGSNQLEPTEVSHFDHLEKRTEEKMGSLELSYGGNQRDLFAHARSASPQMLN